MAQLYPTTIGGTTGIGVVGETRHTFVSPLVFASGNMRTMVEALRQVADRCCGAEPDADGPKGGIPRALSGPGVFGEIEERASQINDMISEANNLISRIERALP